MLIKRIYPTKQERKVLKLLLRGSALKKGSDGSFINPSDGTTISEAIVKSLDASGWLDHHGVMRTLSNGGRRMMIDRDHLISRKGATNDKGRKS